VKTVGQTATVRTLVRTVLENYLDAAPSREPDGAGPAVLGALASSDPTMEDLARQAVGVWLQRAAAQVTGFGLYCGAAGFLGGLQVAADLEPALEQRATRMRAMLASAAGRGAWQDTGAAWEDYDLVLGPSGVVLVLGMAAAGPAEDVLPTARHLARLCDRDDLRRLQTANSRGGDLSAWNIGRVNTGLAHGVAGVIAALSSAAELTGGPEELTVPLRRACRWLADESYVDGGGLVTWLPAGPRGKPPPPHSAHRQAWCYGTPGNAWVLWEAGRVLDDEELRQFAADAMRSFCTVFDEGLHLYAADDGPPGETLAICHGAAGTLAVADAFAHHAALDEASALASGLEDYLFARLDDAAAIGVSSFGLQSGATGVPAVLLTRTGGDRRWLPLLGLR